MGRTARLTPRSLSHVQVRVRSKRSQISVQKFTNVIWLGQTIFRPAREMKNASPVHPNDNGFAISIKVC
jgi:hypothetical protein